VIQNGDGPCLVLAGAGSGKTRTITYRVAYLLEQGVKPEEILLVTFTNKAADEMRRRVAQLAGSQGILPWSGTFHHIGYRILRLYAPLLGYGNNFTVLDSDDSESLIKLCVKNVKPDSAGAKRFPSCSAVLSVISYARNAELPIEVVVEDKFYQWLPFTEEITKIATEYAIRKKEANAMDFDDLLVNLLTLLQDGNIHQKYASQFRYVLVDEYQDTNKIQASIIRRLAMVHNNVVVVGDDAQSIYSFRAADIQNILQFPNEFPGSKIFKLETNYRSSREILDVANSIIAKNKVQYKKTLHATKEGVKPKLFPQLDQQSEGAFVAGKIEELLTSGVPATEIAVLFRASHHSQMLEVELVRRGIAYDYRGGVRFFERSHIKDILAYLRLMNNLADTAAWLRVLLHEEGIGPMAAQKVIEYIREQKNVEGIPEAGRAVLGAKALTGWNNFLRIFETMQSAVVRTPEAMIEALIQSPYRNYLDGEFVDSRDRVNDIKQLGVFAGRYDNLEEFLADATLQESFRGVESEGGAPASSGGKIVLSTIHQAKGLEWQAVFILNLSSGAFPSERALKEENGLEEERRLFYVAITRAKETLYFTYPMAGGSYGDFLSGPSVFIDDIDYELIEDHSLLMNTTVLNDPRESVEYISEDEAPRTKPRPGSFLKDISDL
jgi:DNA helicase-2/ATP-dependent DNA helicase PcrA